MGFDYLPYPFEKGFYLLFVASVRGLVVLPLLQLIGQVILPHQGSLEIVGIEILVAVAQVFHERGGGRF